jgi:Xaa-Pro aminopeptidase
MGRTFDFDARILSLKGSVERSGLEAFIVTGQDSIYYLTGASYTTQSAI